MRVTVSRNGVMLDQLCFEVLGTDAQGVVERTLEMNTGLAAVLAGNDQKLPIGMLVTLPELHEMAPQDQTIKLWD